MISWLRVCAKKKRPGFWQRPSIKEQTGWFLGSCHLHLRLLAANEASYDYCLFPLKWLILAKDWHPKSLLTEIALQRFVQPFSSLRDMPFSICQKPLIRIFCRPIVKIPTRRRICPEKKKLLLLLFHPLSRWLCPMPNWCYYIPL